MDSSHSVSIMIQGLQSGDAKIRNEAAEQIWARFSAQLLDLSRKHLSPKMRVRADEEDVLQSAYNSVCVRMERGRFTEIQNRDDLWKLLITITLNKTRLLARRETRDMRDVRREADAQSDNGIDENPIFELMDRQSPDPAEAAVLMEEAQRRLSVLTPKLRQIALWRLEGFSNVEIASPDKLDCTLRTVERQLGRIRQLWTDADRT